MLFASLRRRGTLVSAEDALPGRAQELAVDSRHAVFGNSIKGPFPASTESIVLGLGCFWGAERLFWRLPGVHTTSAGYAGGFTPNPTYKETCTGRTGHTEVVEVVWYPEQLSLDTILKTFWEQHDPTQGNRQGPDRGTQYRSAIFTTSDEQMAVVEQSAAAYGDALAARGRGPITTEIAPLRDYYFAESYHQQYLHKNPGGYCSLSGTGVACSIPAAAPAA
jgi:peptide-methionine (S)-S-oxide reductase